MNIRRCTFFKKNKKNDKKVNHNITKKNNNKVWRDYCNKHINDPELNGMNYQNKLKTLSIWYKIKNLNK